MDSRSSSGSVVFINLIDKTKEQGQLGQLLRTSLATLAQQMDQQHESSSSNTSRGDKNILEGIDISSLKEPTNRKASNNDIVGTKRLKTVLGVEQRDDLRKTDTADADSPDPTIIVGEGRGAHGGHHFVAPSPTLSPRRKGALGHVWFDFHDECHWTTRSKNEYMRRNSNSVGCSIGRSKEF